MHELDRFFHPRKVAVIGATDNERKAAWALLQKIRAKLEPEGAEIVPVNPRLTEIDGLTCYPSITAIPGEIDLAVVMVSDAESALLECGEKGVHFAIVFTAGFSEIGPEGAARERELERIAAEAGVRLFGPNTNVNAFESFVDRPGDKVCLVTQSGHQGRPVVQGERLGIAFRHWAPVGNEVDLEASDFIEYFAGLDDCGAIAMYIEGFKSGEKLQRALDTAARNQVPVVCVKIGRSEAGARMALAHTGHLTGADRVVDAVFDRYGVTRVDDLDELMEIAGLFTLAPAPRGDRVCVYAISGGTGAHVADLFGAAGIDMPPIADETQQELRKYIPDYLSVTNPVDNGAQTVKSGHNRAIMQALVDDPATDVIVVPITGILESMSIAYCSDIAEFAGSSDKPVIVFWGSPIMDEGFEILCRARVPIIRSFRNGTKALKAFLDWYRFKDDYTPDAVGAGKAATAQEVPAEIPAGTLDTTAARGVLDAAGVPLAPSDVAPDAATAADIATRMGFPVVLKIASRQIAHKSDAGLVAVGVADARSALETAETLLSRAADAFPDAVVSGIEVQKMVTDGVELLLGISQDPTFGPVIAVGMGGIFTEILDDVSLRIPPVDAGEAERMLHELRGRALLEGARGAKPVDLAPVVEAIKAVSRLALDPRVAEVDVNPLIARHDGAWAVDALCVGKEVVGREQE